MNIQTLTLDEVADILENDQQQIELVKEMTGTLIYNIQNSTNNGILINTPFEHFLITV